MEFQRGLPQREWRKTRPLSNDNAGLVRKRSVRGRFLTKCSNLQVHDQNHRNFYYDNKINFNDDDKVISNNHKDKIGGEDWEKISTDENCKTVSEPKGGRKKKKLKGYFEEVEKFNEIIRKRSKRESGKEFVKVFYGNTRSLNKQKEEVLRMLALGEDADVIAIPEAGFLQGVRNYSESRIGQCMQLLEWRSGIMAKEKSRIESY